MAGAVCWACRDGAETEGNGEGATKARLKDVSKLLGEAARNPATGTATERTGTAEDAAPREPETCATAAAAAGSQQESSTSRANALRSIGRL